MGINRGFRSFYSEQRHTAPLPQRSLRICFERREKPARRNAIFYLRTYVFNCSERYKIIQLYRIFIWIYCNFMHTYPLENAVPDDAIVKRFLYINILMRYAPLLQTRKFSPHSNIGHARIKISLALLVRRSVCQSLFFKTALPFYGGKGASAFLGQTKRCLSRERPNRHAAWKAFFKKSERLKISALTRPRN